MKRFTLLLVIFFITIHVNNIIVLCSSTPEPNTTSNFDSTSTTTSSISKTSRSNYGRTIHRIMGGHVQYSGSNSDRHSNDTSLQPHSHFHPGRKMISSKYSAAHYVRNKTEELVPPMKNVQFNENNNIDDSDYGLLTLSAGDGKDEGNKEDNDKKPEGKKTLADQVAEGKYGLIQTELFDKPPKRPGVISYKKNPEVPEDRPSNYGGLKEDDIWLSDDHLLVLKGGSLNKNDAQEAWKPIDDYEAPSRQVKLPKNPKVPPPFPVQLTDNGPVQFIGNNQFPVYNPFTNDSLFLFTNKGFAPEETNDSDKKNLFTGYGTPKNNTQFNGYQYPPPVTFNDPNQTFSNPFLNLPPLPPFAIPPPGQRGPPISGSFDDQNITQPFDEDDPSFYYPPPYSFEYKSNYTNPVPPGPLVPGIILPPPPSFFAPLDDEEDNRPVKTPLDVLNKIQSIKLREKLTTATPPTTTIPTLKLRPSNRGKITHTTSAPETNYVEIQRVKVKEFVPTTILKTTTSAPPRYQQPNVEIKKVNVKEFFPQDIRENVVLKPVGPTRLYTSTFAPTTPRTRPTTKPYTSTTPPTTTSKSRTVLKKIPPSAPVSISFVPKITSPNENFGKGNPIYFEYYDARTPTPHPLEVYSTPATADFSSTSEFINHSQVTQRPIFKQVVSTPSYEKARPDNTYLPIKDSDYDKFLYITPKPDIKPNGITNNFIPISSRPTLSLKPVPSFEKEVETIRQTIKFYEDRGPTHPTRTPKTKTVYEYSFDASKSQADDHNPFRPIVTYSEPIDPGFNPPKYYSSSSAPPISGVKLGKYLRTSTYRTPSKVQYYNQGSRKHKTPPPPPPPPPQNQFDEYETYNDNLEYSITTAKPYRNQPWYSIEKQVVKELPHQQQNYYGPEPVIYSNGASGYNQNDAYVKQINHIKEQLQRYPQNNQNNDGYYQQPSARPQRLKSSGQKYIPQVEIPLNRDVLVNYKYPLPPVNPDSELLPYSPNYRSRYLESPIIQYRLPGDRAHVYFITPQELKYSKK